MEISEKAFARQKFRTSRGRGRGRAVQGGVRGPARPHKDLDSNAYRYGDDTDVEDEGNVVPKSQGADLGALIEDADVIFNQAFYRFRTQLHDITAEVPPLGVANQLLDIDLEALAASLSVLPLHTLLGLEPQYMQGVELAIEGRGEHSPIHSRPSTTPTSQETSTEQQHRSVTQCAPTLSPRASKLGIVTPTADAGMQQQPLLTTLTLGEPAPAQMPVPGPASVLAPASVPPVKVMNTATSAAAVAGDASMSVGVDADAAADDDELEALLMGRAPRPAQTTPSSVFTARTVGQVTASCIRPAWPAMPTVLPSVMAATKAVMKPADLKPAGLQGQAQMEAVFSPGLATKALGPDGATPAASRMSVVGSEPASSGPSLPVTSHLPFSDSPTVASLGGTPGVVRVSPTGLAFPAEATVPSPSVPGIGAAPPAPKLTVWPAARTVTPTVLVASASGAVGPQVGVKQLAVGGKVPTMPPPAKMLAQRQLPVAVTAAGASTSGSGGPEEGVVDRELRLLLGLPLEAGGPSKATGLTTAVTRLTAPQLSPQVKPSLGMKGTTVTTMPPAAKNPSAQQQASKSLDEWLNSV